MKAGRWIVRGALALLAVPLLYLLGALIGAIVPAGGSASAPRDGVTIFVRTNDVHTWLMVPTVAAGIDWRPLAPARDLADPARAGDYLAFGWGSRAFYLNTPTWHDLTLRTATGALFGNGPALMHVDHERQPARDDRRTADPSDGRPVSRARALHSRELRARSRRQCEAAARARLQRVGRLLRGARPLQYVQDLERMERRGAARGGGESRNLDAVRAEPDVAVRARRPRTSACAALAFRA